MKNNHIGFPEQHSNEYGEEDTQKLPPLHRRGTTGTLEKDAFDMDSSNISPQHELALEEVTLADQDEIDTNISPDTNGIGDTNETFDPFNKTTDDVVGPGDETAQMPELATDNNESVVGEEVPPQNLVEVNPPPVIHPSVRQQPMLSRGQAILLVALVVIVALNAINLGSSQFLGPQGWASVLGGPATNNNQNPLDTVGTIIRNTTPSSGAKGKQKLTPAQYINLLIQNMTLDQKLGQMMIVQFYGPEYSLDINTMISQYNVGAVLLFTSNNNIQSKLQLKGLIQQMKSNSTIPLTVAIDQEGGTVDRLISLDGPRPSATSIGETGNLVNAYNEGVRDANDLSSYGFNLNLAPVVDVNNVYNPQMYLRTFGNNPTTVTQMAEAYLKGLQQSGKVLGTLKHFPGLGDVAADPHSSVPHLTRSESDLMKIDWAPYRGMIQQGNVYSIMVTHELVTAVDGSIPSSLSYKLVTGILRDQLGFQGVIMTDSLTMEGILAYYTEAQAAVVAVEAGDDLLMGASTPSDLAAMITGLKQAINAGQISQQRIDDSVRRILTMKYQMGLLHIPTN